MKTFLQHSISLFERGEPFAIATVLSREGSAPRRAGARMIIRKNGKSFGTIGGGSLEAEVFRSAEQVLANQHPVVRQFDLTGSIDSATMLCGGRVEVLIDYVDPGRRELHSAWHAALQAFQTKTATWLITAVPDNSSAPPSIFCCLTASGETTGALQPDKDLLDQVKGLASARLPWLTQKDGKRFFVEPLTGLPRVLIFGSGHIAQQLAMLTVLAAFKT
ncbi:MAG: XdhC family protein, partial [Deltaproteobacteria bacterium]|nr:XdhC family protein [Deltaproteobacteria bacterium]